MRNNLEHGNAMISRDRDIDNNGTLDERLYVLQDANFNVTGLVNTSGTVVERFTYEPFGKVEIRDASWVIKSGGSGYSWLYLHQGGRFDSVSGLYAFRMREYSPTLGRWMTNDPIGFKGKDVNLRRYITNMPLNKCDPTGLIPPDPPYGWFYEERKLLMEVQAEDNAKQLASTDAALKAMIQLLDLPCQKAKDMTLAAINELVQIARQTTTGAVGLFGDCDNWQNTALSKMHNVIQKYRKAGVIGRVFDVDGVSWGNSYTFGWAGHNAVRIQFFDGTNIYLDDSNRGGVDRVFVDSEIPSRYTPLMPVKAFFVLDHQLRNKCKTSGKKCWEYLCGN